MNRIILSIFFITACAVGHGQVVRNPQWDNVTIYEYGVSRTSCESNFVNLFQNWPKWITNFQQTKLLSYKYVETLNDSNQIEYYAVLLNDWKSLWPRIVGSHNEKGNADTTIYTRELYFYAEPMENIPEVVRKDPPKEALYQSECESKFKIMREYFRKTINIGDKVYVIKMTIGGKKYDHHVVCRPGENKIVFDTLFLGIYEKRDILDKLY